jgi:hypothetical protein
MPLPRRCVRRQDLPPPADTRAGRGFYDLGTDVRPALSLADAFAELTLVI